MQAANQFTPDQLIVAGRRAEAQGQPAYALQFYRYVADQFPASTEAYEARDALFRLTPQNELPVSQRQQPHGGQTLGAATGYASPPHAQQGGQQGGQQGAPSPQQASFGELRPHNEPAAEPASRTRTERVKPRQRPAEPAAHASAVLQPARGYRIGRIVAAMLNTIGWLCLLGAIVMLPLIITAVTVKAFPKALKDAIAGSLMAFGGGTLGLLLIGLFAIFAGQVARATFDTADATRALYEANAGGQ